MVNCVAVKFDQVRLEMEEVESSDSLRYPSNWGGGKTQVSQVPWSVSA